MRKLIATVLLAGLLASTASHAGAVMNLVTKDGAGKQTGEIVISADGDRVRMDQPGDSVSIIFLGDRILILDHREQAYIVMDDAMIDEIMQQMREFEAQLAAMPPEQRAMVEQMMQGQMAGMMPDNAAKPPTPRIESLGSGSWGDYSCRKYEMYEGDAKVADFCSAPFSAIEGGEEATDAMFGMIDYMQKIIDAMPPALGAMIADNPLDYIREMDGFPVHSVSYESGKVVEEMSLESVTETDLAADLFAAPANYRKQETGM